jgi:hypothetical protein
MVCPECARLKKERAEAYAAYFESEHGDARLDKNTCRNRWLHSLEAEESHCLAFHENDVRHDLRAGSLRDWISLLAKLGYKPK